jgi:hypothetical protein
MSLEAQTMHSAILSAHLIFEALVSYVVHHTFARRCVHMAECTEHTSVHFQLSLLAPFELTSDDFCFPI